MATTGAGTPYVESSDLVANYPAVSESLAERVDLVGILPFANSAARTSAIPSPTDGQYSYLQDTNATEYWNGSAWVAPLPDPETWTTFTPTIGNLTVGNGTVTARYIQIGDFVYVQVAVVFGSTTSITGGALDLTWPVAGTGLGGNTIMGIGTLQDITGSQYVAPCVEVGSTARITRLFVSGTEVILAGVSSTAPFIWTTGDRMTFQIQYKAA